MHQLLGLEPEHRAEKATGLHDGAQTVALVPETLRNMIRSVPKATAVQAICSNPDATAIAEKFLRLEKYCADSLRGKRLHTVETTELHVEYSSQNVAEFSVNQRAELLAGLLEICEFQIFRSELLQTENRFLVQIAWTHAPAAVELPSSGSALLSDHLLALIASDPARAWRIGGAAEQLGLTGRSLQRYLLAEGTTFSSILRTARTQVAKQYLMDRKVTLSEVGFCCGYADQAHFQREFRSVVGLTPRKFRLSKHTN